MGEGMGDGKFEEMRGRFECYMMELSVQIFAGEDGRVRTEEIVVYPRVCNIGIVL